MSNRIDYSKWDKIDYGSDDESSSYEENQPKVTRLNEPGKVTISPQGLSIDDKDQNFVKAPKESRVPSAVKGVNKEKGTRIKILTKNGSQFIDPQTKNVVYWSQDRNEVNLSIVFDHTSIASKDIRVEVAGSLNYEQRHSAVGNSFHDGIEGSKGKLTVKAVGQTNAQVILEGILCYPIYLPEGEEQVDWEIDVTDPSMKMIRITLLKAVPMQGLTVWWSRPLLHFTQIDVVADIEGRMGSGSSSIRNRTNAVDEWKQSWDEAHRMFKEKTKSRQKTTIDTSNEDDETI